MSWFYAKDDQKVGPVSESELHAQASSGVISADTLVWTQGMGDWTAYESIAETVPAPAALGGSKLKVAEFEPLVSPFQREEEAVEVRFYAGFWIRFVAKMVDNTILGLFTFGIVIAAVFVVLGSGSKFEQVAQLLNVIAQLVQVVIYALYHMYFVGKYGATPGKMICKLRVIRPDGGDLSYWRALGRYFGEWLSQFTLSIGYIMAAFDDEKRSLHDRVCSTRVIRI